MKKELLVLEVSDAIDPKKIVCDTVPDTPASPEAFEVMLNILLLVPEIPVLLIASEVICKRLLENDTNCVFIPYARDVNSIVFELVPVLLISSSRIIWY